MADILTDGPSAHLSWRELSCHDGTAYPQEWRADRAAELALAFEDVRSAYGAPIAILSAYRTPEHNRRVGGAPASQHVQGRALDLAPVRGGRKALADLTEAVQTCAKQLGRIRGVGVYRSFVHMDVRQSDRLARWNGSRPAADTERAA